MKHLTRHTAALVDAPLQSRLSWINRHRQYEYSAAAAAVKALETALYRPQATPATTYVVYGPKSNGKTTLVRSLQPEHGEAFIDSTEHESNGVYKPMIWPSEVAGAAPSCIAEEILGCFHGGHSDDDDEETDRAIGFLGRYCPVQLLVLEWASPKWPSSVLMYLERIRVESDTSLVLFDSEWSVKEAETWMGEKPRRQALHLPEWTPGPRLRRLLRTIESETPLPKPSGLGGMRHMEAVCAVAGTSLGGILKTVRDAAGRAMRSGAPAIRATDYEPVRF